MDIGVNLLRCRNWDGLMAKHLRIMNEWRTIKELPSYEVSSDGRVRRKDKLRELKEKLDRYGYPSVGLYCSETKRK